MENWKSFRFAPSQNQIRGIALLRLLCLDNIVQNGAITIYNKKCVSKSESDWLLVHLSVSISLMDNCTQSSVICDGWLAPSTPRQDEDEEWTGWFGTNIKTGANNQPAKTERSSKHFPWHSIQCWTKTVLSPDSIATLIQFHDSLGLYYLSTRFLSLCVHTCLVPL